MSGKFEKLGLILGVACLVTAFQNCAEADFSSSLASGSGHTVTYPSPNTALESGSENTRTVNSKADVLFVVDESASMGSILTQFKAGFESLSSNVYPADTMMAVTNMAPAPYTNFALNVFDPSKSWINDASTAAQPGFLKFVNRASIASFKSAYPTPGAQFTQQGCTNSWFRPLERSPEGILCLNAHSQIGLIGTGVEAGVVSLSQLVKNLANQGKRTFREGSLANVIFVSDTHEPGSSGYFGASKAPPNYMAYDTVVQQIHSANPNLAGLKFHGIVPLPPAGDSRLNNVNTIGYIPPTLADSNVSGESMWDFHYMEFIKKSGGAAMHPLNNVWSSALHQMVQEASVQRTPLFVTRHEIKDLIEVKVNGVTLNAGEFTLRSDKRTIELHYNAAWPTRIDIQARYTF